MSSSSANQEIPEQLLLVLGREQTPTAIDFQVRRNRRSRRLSLSVLPSGKVEVLAPIRSSDAAIQKFVRTNSRWIDETRAAFRRRFGEKDQTLPQQIALPAIDRFVAVRYQREPSDTVRVRGRSQLTVAGDTDNQELCRDALKRWLSRVAKREFSQRLKTLSTKTGLEFRQLQVRLQRTCWGSHSSSGTISLNYSLAFLQAEQLDYILIHELCHSRHMDHSRAFWKLVETWVPDYRRIDRSMDQAWTQLPGWLDIY